MRTLKLIAIGLASLAVIIIATPLLWAMGRDLRERNAIDAADDGDPYPYDDDDIGVDVDGYQEFGGEA